MPGGGKGPSSAGSITQTTTNPTQQAQLPFLTDLWNSTQQNARANPFQYYPGQTLATNNPAMLQGYDQLYSTAQQNQNGLSPQSSSALSGIYGTGQGAQANLAATASGNNPFMTDIGSVQNNLNRNFNTGLNFAQGNDPTQARVSGITDQLGNLAVGGGLHNSFLNTGTRNLADEANGGYLAASNPYLSGMFNAAADPVVRQYMTATAPQTDSNFEAAGRYGSGALANARGQNESNLVTGLGHMASNIYGTNYENERGLQNSAASTLAGTGLGFGSLQGQLLTNAGNLGLGNINSRIAGLNSSNAALGEQGQLYSNELTAQNNAGLGLSGDMVRGLALSPSIMSSTYQPAQQMTAAGQGVTGLAQQQIQDAIARFQGNIRAPWETLQGEAGLFGQPTTGSNSQTTPLLGPSPLSSALGTIGGLNSLGSSGLFGGSGGGLLSAGGLLGSQGPLFGTAADASIAAGGAPLALGASGGGKGLAEALPFLAAV
jgi:hypothetical protein